MTDTRTAPDAATPAAAVPGCDAAAPAVPAPASAQRPTPIYGPAFAADPQLVYDRLRRHGAVAPVEIAPASRPCWSPTTRRPWTCCATPTPSPRTPGPGSRPSRRPPRCCRCSATAPPPCSATARCTPATAG
ncbi:hypothetical protein ACFQ0M_32920 [Kitasatospora aburaviensis]